MPPGLIGMAVLVLVAEGFVARREFRFATRLTASWRFSDRAAGRVPADVQVLCLGDSLVKLGVLPRVLEHRLGRPAYNLAAPGGQAPTTFFLLRRALTAHAAPTAVVVDFHPNLLAVAPRSSGPLWPEILTIQECLDLSIVARDPSLFLDTALPRLLPTLRDRGVIRSAIASALRGGAPPGSDEVRAVVRNWRVNAGAQVVPRLGLAAGVTGSIGEDRLTRWRPHRANTVYVRRFLDLAAARGIRVFWLLPPASPDWQGRLDRLDLTAQYTRYARRMQSMYPNLVVVDGRHAGYDRSVFRDATHLDRRGASALSQALAGVIGPHLDGSSSGPRWVELPGYREPAEVIPLEDLDQSRVVLQALDARRR